jgi:hypothetical protein
VVFRCHQAGHRDPGGQDARETSVDWDECHVVTTFKAMENRGMLLKQAAFSD